MAKTSKPISGPVGTGATAVTEATGTATYVVTAKAPMKVAGRRVKAGDSLTLTEDQARGELLALHIRPQAETTTAE